MSIFSKALETLGLRIQNGDVPAKTQLVEVKLQTEDCINNKLIYNVNNKSVIVITCNGDKFEGNNVEKEQLEQLRTANISEIINILTPKQEVNLTEKEEKEIVSNFLEVFKDSEDFDVVGKELYFKGIKTIPIPTLITARFVELVESLNNLKVPYITEVEERLKEEYNSLKMFTYWLLLNPIESARKDALKFIEKNNLPITDNGMLVTFRKVVSTGQKDKELVEFISNSYFKIKGQKKSPLNYNVYKNSEANLVLHNINNKNIDFVIDYGNLSDLYKNLPNMVENTFTDNHTKTKLIKIGEVYKEDEDKINLDNNVACGSGIHSGSVQFSYDSFGDTGVVCLVNPMKIRSVPVADCSKMRSSELFPVAIVDFDNYKEFTETNEIKELSEIYYNESLKTLRDTLKSKSFDKLTCQEELPQISLKEIQNITELLKSRVVRL